MSRENERGARQAGPPDARTVFLLHRLYGLSYAQIAQNLGLIEKHIASALAALATLNQISEEVRLALNDATARLRWTAGGYPPFNEGNGQLLWVTSDYEGCTMASAPRARIKKPEWSQDPAAQKFFSENRAGALPIGGPLPAIAGERDTAVPLGAVRDVVGRACHNQQHVFYRSYPGLEHDEAMLKTVADQTTWIKDRFADKPPQVNYPRTS